MSAVREFPSVSVNNNTNVIQINTNDSNFSVVPGSVIFIVGDRPRVVTSGNTVNRTLTLAIAYTGNDIVEKSATLIPLGQNDALLSAITSLTQAQNGLAEAYGDGPGSVGEISFSMIVDPPVTATQWPTWVQVQGDINDVLPDTAKRFPNFPEIGGTVSSEQLPESVTQDKKSLALSPPVRQNPSLTHILSDYPTLKKTEVLPADSPNNERQIRFDDVRGLVHISLTDRWITIPTVIDSRKFAIFQRGTIIRLNSAYSGSIKLRVYPMGVGGNGLPDNPTLANHQWHEYETTVTDLYKIGEFNSEYFEGIIDYVELDNSWATLDADHSYYRSLNGYFDVAFGTLKSPFRTFYQRADGYWYSEDITPQTPNYMGLSWTQDPNNYRNYSVDDASGSTDALRFFGDDYDDYSFEIILIVHSMNRHMAVTISNSAPNIVYEAEPYRFLTEAERVYFKRRNNGITGSMTVESIKIRIPVSEY
tara:strand:- start:4971 stop:6401 length:1431 start_codon:yes stop_codon:yes gene_type:complete